MLDKQKEEDSKQDIIDAFEKLLERAKRGEVRNFYAVVLFEKEAGTIHTLRHKSCIHDLAMANVFLKELLEMQHAELIEILHNEPKDHVH